MARLPKYVRSAFWDVDIDSLTWSEHGSFIIGRILAHGNHSAIAWVRHKVGDEQLRDWLVRTRARGLRPEQVTFWGLVLQLPDRLVRDLLTDDRRWTGGPR